MEVEILMSNLVKPSTPTPSNLKNYIISFTDELAPTINVPLILYYPPPPKAQNGQFANIFHHLEISLSKTLTDFYPLAGRYMKHVRLVDCSDQGARYVCATTKVHLSYILGPEWELKPDQLNKFLPCEIGEADEIDDPLVSIKVTKFDCGGLAIGMCFAHRLSDMAMISLFIDNWATRSRGILEIEKYSPIFNSNLYFPQRGLPKLDLRVPRSSIGVKSLVRRFVFKGKAIAIMRENVSFKKSGGHKLSKLQLVLALLWKAFIRIDGQSKASFVIEAVNLRDKVIPQLPENSYGNFWGLATALLGPGEGDKIDFQDFFELLRNSIKEIIKDCTKVLTHSEDGYRVVIDPYLESNRNIEDDDVNFYLFTCWSKFSFYKADFGWGMPVWASTAHFPVQNLVILFDDQNGDGIDAWVHLDEKRMSSLEQDPNIKSFII